jgi:hypothetical protein
MLRLVVGVLVAAGAYVGTKYFLHDVVSAGDTVSTIAAIVMALLGFAGGYDLYRPKATSAGSSATT